MSKKSKKNKSSKEGKPNAQPWISMRSGLRVIAITSVLLAGLIVWQVVPSRGWMEAILWGVLFAGLVWVIFFGNLFISKFLRK